MYADASYELRLRSRWHYSILLREGALENYLLVTSLHPTRLLPAKVRVAIDEPYSSRRRLSPINDTDGCWIQEDTKGG